jgi:hypothetical protein
VVSFRENLKKKTVLGRKKYSEVFFYINYPFFGSLISVLRVLKAQTTEHSNTYNKNLN